MGAPVATLTSIAALVLAMGCGSSRPARDARLSGSVFVCQAPFGKCTIIPATVTLLTARRAGSDALVARQYATHGRFSFTVAPGRYLPSVATLPVGLQGGRCAAGETVVYARQGVHDNVRCTIPPAPVRQARESRPRPRYVQRSRLLKEVIVLPSGSAP